MSVIQSSVICLTATVISLTPLRRIGTLKEPFFPGSLKKAVHDDPYLTLGTACNWPDLLIGRVDL